MRRGNPSGLPHRSALLRCLALVGLLAATGLAGGGCAPIDTYKPAVDGFAAAAGKTSDAYAALQSTVIAARTEYLEQSALKGKVRVRTRMASGDCARDSQRCRLEVTGGGETKDLVLELGNITLLLREIADYAANLQAVVGADTAEQVNAKLAAAGGSIKNLGGDLAALPGGTAIGGDIGAFAAPSVDLAAWIAGESINALQVEALRRATQAADPVIQQSAKVLEGAVTAAGDVTRPDFADRVSDASDGYVRARGDRGALEQFMHAAADYDAMLTATAPDVFADMATAHRRLAESLSAKNVTLADAFAAIQRFGAKASALKSIVDKFQAAKTQAADAKK